MTELRDHPVELLAQLDADALGPLASARARRELARDPRTPAAAAALAATRAELAALAAQPPPELPADVAARCASALADLPPPPPPATPSRSEPWRTRAAALLVAAAVLAGAVAVGISWLHRAEPPAPLAGPPPLTLTHDQLAAALSDGLAERETGPLTDPGRLAACQHAAGLPAQQPLGGRQVVLDGQPGVLLVLPTSVLGRFRLVVVGEDCGIDQQSPVLADVIAGR